MDLKLLMVHKQNLLKNYIKKKKNQTNKEEEYIPIIQMVGLIKHSTTDFTNIELPK